MAVQHKHRQVEHVLAPANSPIGMIYRHGQHMMRIAETEVSSEQLGSTWVSLQPRVGSLIAFILFLPFKFQPCQPAMSKAARGPPTTIPTWATEPLSPGSPHPWMTSLTRLMVSQLGGAMLPPGMVFHLPMAWSPSFQEKS